MTPERLLIIGASGHCKVVVDAMMLGGSHVCIVVGDDDANKNGMTIFGHTVVAPIPDTLLKEVRLYHIAIGHNPSRERISRDMEQRKLSYIAVTHTRACVSGTAVIDPGVFIAAHAVVGPDCHLGRGVIVNHGAVVDHDCRVDVFAHIAPNATLAGGVRVGKRTLIGAGVNVLPGVSIGDDCIVGAGAVVLSDLAPGSVYVGVPVRKVNT